MWGGRFDDALDPDLLAFTSSLADDRRLLRSDILASIAHAQMLGDARIIPPDDARAIAGGLRGILADVDAGRLQPAGPFEDVHSFIEAALYDRIGAPAGRLHTARSRNDQVATAFRLCLKGLIAGLVACTRDLMALAAERAAATLDVVMPGFTHFQHAQPVRLAHHLLAYLWMLDRDADRLIASHRRADVLPLGSGALAGVSFPVDRAKVAARLGFSQVSANSIDATGDRDFAADTVFAAALVMVHLSRWADEIVIWATQEFGFVRLSDAVATGSSLMPQKKNPDPAELIRGKTGRVIGDLTALLVTMKGLPAGYHRDFQEDKPAVFDALDTAAASLRAMHRLLAGTEFVPERMAQAAREGVLTATDLADYLVRKGVPFREAHELAGRVAQVALARGVPLWELPVEAFHSVSPSFDEDVVRAVTIEASVESKRATGGTARSAVEAQLAAARDRIGALGAWLQDQDAARARLNALLEA